MLNKDIVILFVDDEVSTLHALERYLLNESFCLLFAKSGKQALEIIKKQTVHILVTDMKMPEMDGLELLKIVRNEFPGIVRLVLSGYSRLSSIIPAINSGEIFRYITKPIDPEMFKKTLRDAVDFYLINQDKKDLLESLKNKNQALTLAVKEKEDAQKELDHAQMRIEKNLLAGKPPENLGNVNIAILSRSAKNIGGDFYDIVKSFPDGFDIIIGDVMGKGVLAALVGAGMKQSFLKALAERSNTSQGLPPPDIVTQRVSKWMTPGLMDLESFVTIVFARIDQNMKTMSFTDCGHTPVLQYLAFEKKIIMHKGQNLPIGVQAEEIIQETTFNIYPGDLLFFMSDGVIETTSPEGELYGLDRFSEFVESHQHLTADEIIYGLEKELDSFKGKLENQDDITCICIKLPVS